MGGCDKLDGQYTQSGKVSSAFNLSNSRDFKVI